MLPAAAATSTADKWRTRFAQQRRGIMRSSAFRQARAVRPSDAQTHPLPTRRSSARRARRRTARGFSKHQVWRVLRQLGVSLRRRRSWCLSTDPEFARKAADIGTLPQPAGKRRGARGRREAEHPGLASAGLATLAQRQGLDGLLARLQAARHDAAFRRAGSGYRIHHRRILAPTASRVSRLHEPHRGHPRRLHIILDNLNTHKPKNDRWLQRHANIHFHYTPTYSSWMNQVEVWFSILSRRALRGASHFPPAGARGHHSFVRVYNSKATPFEWTKTVVAPRPLASKYSNLRN